MGDRTSGLRVQQSYGASSAGDGNAGERNAAGAVQLQSIHMYYQTGSIRRTILNDVTLGVEAGSFVAIVGPSGCGKSTLLNIVGGVVRPSRGNVFIGGRRVEGGDAGIDLGYVTQNDNLIPWRTAQANVEIALEIRGVKKEVRAARAREQLNSIGLYGSEDLYPAQLSGGMRKRVTLARSLIYQPSILLMDEAFGALDAQLKLVIEQDLIELWSRTTMTVLYVTHDLVEAISMADVVVVMGSKPGRVLAIEEVDIPRPRDLVKVRFDPRFERIHDSLWSHLRRSIS